MTDFEPRERLNPLQDSFEWNLFSGWSGEDAYVVFAKDGRNQTISGFYFFPKSMEMVAKHVRKRFRDNGEQVKILVVGVANGQEPCSYLTFADTIARSIGEETTIADVAELHLMDVLKRRQVHLYTKFGHVQIQTGDFSLDEPPESVAGSFFLGPAGWELNESIRQAFREAAHSRRAYWGCDICSDIGKEVGRFDVVSANRVLPYVTGRAAKMVAVARLAELVRPGGILLSSEADDGPMSDLFNLERNDALKDFVPLGSGVFRRELSLWGSRSRSTMVSGGFTLPVRTR